MRKEQLRRQSEVLYYQRESLLRYRVEDLLRNNVLRSATDLLPKQSVLQHGSNLFLERHMRSIENIVLSL